VSMGAIVDSRDEASLHILVVDDDEATRRLLRRLLEMEGYSVDEAPDGPAAMAVVARREPDLILLDIMMPGIDGLDLLSMMRRTSRVPVILLSAKSSEADRVVGLRLGADDYVVKPFSTGELAARIAAVLRRAGASRSPGRLEFGALEIDLARRQVSVGGRPIDLPAREYEVLTFLAASPGEVFSREQLLAELWGSGPADDRPDPATVTEHIGRLRRRIEENPEQPRWVRTVRGIGYRFDP
jgi:two-component system phosphate regulon response regulator PhoB